MIAKKPRKTTGVVAEFKAFISRGNVLDMAVGVIIGGAFSAIVTGLVNILMSLCSWGIPGGIKGLVTVLPAINDAQKGPVGQKFSSAELANKVVEFAQANGATSVVDANSDAFVQWQNTLLSKYTLHGTTYTYNFSAVIDWGTFINAIISFIIIAIVLFIIIKVVAGVKAKKAEMDAKMLEAYYEKHPEERPAPVEPGVPEPTTNELLAQIRDLLKEGK